MPTSSDFSYRIPSTVLTARAECELTFFECGDGLIIALRDEKLSAYDQSFAIEEKGRGLFHTATIGDAADFASRETDANEIGLNSDRHL